MEIFIYLSAAVSLITLVCFFVLCGNTAEIKREAKIANGTITDQNYWSEQYKKYRLQNRDADAIHALQQAVYLNVMEQPPGAKRQARHAEMKEKYGAIFDEYNTKFMRVPN